MRFQNTEKIAKATTIRVIKIFCNINTKQLKIYKILILKICFEIQINFFWYERFTTWTQISSFRSQFLNTSCSFENEFVFKIFRFVHSKNKQYTIQNHSFRLIEFMRFRFDVEFKIHESFLFSISEHVLIKFEINDQSSFVLVNN